MAEIRDRYQRRRDVLCEGLNNAGWPVDPPKATMFVWAKIPEAYREMGSLEFAKKLIREAKVAAAPGIGFGEYGDNYVRFGLIENEHRTRQAVRGIRDMLRKVVTEGTASFGEVEGYAVGGKTGTADKPRPRGGYYKDKVIATFASVFPANDPKYVLVVTLDEPEETSGTEPRRTAGWTAVPVAAVSAEPPVLRGRTEHPFLLAAGAATLLVVALLVGFLAPALPQEGNGVYSSAVPLTEAAIEGRELYRSEGCSSCHTQVVRPIVADVGLGPVTISDSNQVLGVRRYGPDLAHIGSRVESQSTLLAVLTSSSDHP